MQERLQSGQSGECVLFFGCRRADQDFLYGEQLQAWAAAGHLQLFTAFSREQVSRMASVCCSH